MRTIQAASYVQVFTKAELIGNSTAHNQLCPTLPG